MNKDITSLRSEYASIVKEIRSVCPNWTFMNTQIEFNAQAAQRARFGACDRFYTPELKPSPADYINGAKQALEFAKWFTLNRLEKANDSAPF